MLHNDACPNIKVNPQTFDVYVDGKIATCEPAQRFCRSRRDTCCDDRGPSAKLPGVARIGIGGPVGSGKTALVERLIPVMKARNLEVGVVANDIVTQEDAERIRALGLDRSCPRSCRRDRGLSAYRHPRGPDLEHSGGREPGRVVS